MNAVTGITCTLALKGRPVVMSFAEWERQHKRGARRAEALRWSLSFVLVLAVAGVMAASFVRMPDAPVPVPEPAPAAIAIDMAPQPVSVPTPPTDMPVGPKEAVSGPTPHPAPPPKITAPPVPATNPRVPVPREEKHKAAKKKTKPTASQKKLPLDRTPPAEATTAPPVTEAVPAPMQAAPVAGASSVTAAHDPTTWQGALLAQLEKFRRYPATAMSAQQEGTPSVTFSMDRRGHVLSVTLASSSGYPMLDHEALALPRRAEPLPVPPDSVAGDIITLTVPVEFSLHHN